MGLFLVNITQIVYNNSLGKFFVTDETNTNKIVQSSVGVTAV